MPHRCMIPALAVLAGGALAAAPAAAQSGEPPAYCEPSTLVAYHNGMRTQRAAAWANLAELESRVVRAQLTGEELERVDFDLFYNSTAGTWSDLREAMAQLEVLEAWRDFLAVQAGDAEGQVNYAEVFGRRLVAQLDSNIDAATVINHAERYRTALGRGDTIIAFAHSQGNIYFNLTVNQLTGEERSSVGVVAIASPAEERGAQGGHVTLSGEHGDEIIGWIRTFGRTTLAPNIDNSSPGGDSENHGLVESYLRAGTGSLAEIRRIFQNLFNSLSNDSEFGAGAISVTLRWDEQPDVDLHVFEPNGTQVFYANRQGQSGQLDRDDVDGVGPENYFVPCETLEFGTYRVGLNYFRGDAPTRTVVDIEAGEQFVQRSQTLNEDRGSAGNSTPIPIADIIVEQGAQENDPPVFTIQPR